jgi:HPt (histidine-containing phosphotransfer) domain-containing protein
MDEMIIALDEAAKSEDYITYKRTLHNVKGISANLRLEDITSAVSDMYAKLKIDEQIDLSDSLQTIKELLEQIRKEINTYFNRSL